MTISGAINFLGGFKSFLGWKLSDLATLRADDYRQRKKQQQKKKIL